jgi:hypothetical protein
VTSAGRRLERRAEAISGGVADAGDVGGVAPSGGGFMLGCVMDDDYVGGMPRGFAVRRVRMPSSGVESWTVVGPDARLVGLVDEFLAG